MEDLADLIRSAVIEDRFVVSFHASERCEEREVTVWQIVEGFSEGKLIETRPDDEPYPSIIFEVLLLGGRTVHVVWSWMERSKRAKLVTVYFPE